MKVDEFAIAQPIKKLSVLMAAYNESTTIISTLSSLRAVIKLLPFECEVIVVESNSTDGTRELLQKNAGDLGIILLLEEIPRGKGAAIRMGMARMSGDVFLIFDADEEYAANDIPKLLIPIENGRTSFVLGTRHQKGVAMRILHGHRIRSILMNFAHFFFTSLINVTYGTKMKDPFTMYKVFRSDVFAGVKLSSNRFDFDWELVCKALNLGCAPVEVPVSYKSRSFAEGKKVRFFKDPLTWIWAYIKFGILSR